MTDIVQRLREQEMGAWAHGWKKGETRRVIREAAAEIEQLQAALVGLSKYGRMPHDKEPVRWGSCVDDCTQCTIDALVIAAGEQTP